MLARMAGQLANFQYAEQLGSIDLHAVLEASRFYSSEEWCISPGSFFETPRGIIAPKITPVHGLADGEISDIEFPSIYKVQHPEARARWEEYPENRVVHARMWKHGTPAPATIIAVHGWTMGDQRINSLAFLPGLFYRMGLDIVLMELPFHGRRAPQAMADAGLSFFPSPEITNTNEAMGQTISDLRQMKLVLRALGCKEIGAMGMSLGAYAAALWASLEKLAFCVPMVPLVSMSEMAWNVLAQHPEFSKWRGEGLTPELMNDCYRVHSPLAHSLKIGAERTMIIAGFGDSIVPSRQPKLLWDHWKRPNIVWLSGGHSAHIKKDVVVRELLSFFKGLGYVA